MGQFNNQEIVTFPSDQSYLFSTNSKPIPASEQYASTPTLEFLNIEIISNNTYSYLHRSCLFFLLNLIFWDCKTGLRFTYSLNINNGSIDFSNLTTRCIDNGNGYSNIILKDLPRVPNICSSENGANGCVIGSPYFMNSPGLLAHELNHSIGNVNHDNSQPNLMTSNQQYWQFTMMAKHILALHNTYPQGTNNPDIGTNIASELLPYFFNGSDYCNAKFKLNARVFFRYFRFFLEYIQDPSYLDSLKNKAGAKEKAILEITKLSENEVMGLFLKHASKTIEYELTYFNAVISKAYKDSEFMYFIEKNFMPNNISINNLIEYLNNDYNKVRLTNEKSYATLLVSNWMKIKNNIPRQME